MISVVSAPVQATITPITRRRRTRRATPVPNPALATPTPIFASTGVVDQVRVACDRQHRLATGIGALIGGIVPFATFCVAHYEMDTTAPWGDPRGLLVLGGLLYSARTVYQWGRLALESALKAVGFTVLLEGIMIGSRQEWLAITVLVYLVAINAIATGVTLARGQA